MCILVLSCCVWLVGNLCIYSKRKIEEVIGIGLCILILLLQVLGMVRHLSWIGMFLMAGSCILLGIHIYRREVKHVCSEIRKYMFTFGGAVFLVMSALCIWLQYSRRVRLYDEFNFWATAIKTLWNYDGFASGIEVWYFWEYPQGMPLLEWFGTYLLGSYAEWPFYAIRLMFDFSLIMPVFKHFRIRYYWSPLAAVLVYLLPGIANSTSYDVLSVDGDLALLFGFFIYCILERKRRDAFYYIRAVILSCTIVLVKEFSIVFVIYGWILLLVLDYSEKKEGRRKRVVRDGALIVFPVFTLISWTWYLKAAGYKSTVLQKGASYFIESLLNGTWQGTGYENDLLRAFFKCFFVGKANFCLSADNNKGVLTPFMIVAGIAGTIVFLAVKKYIDRRMRNVLIFFWGFVVVTYSVLFFIAHDILFAGEIGKYIEFTYMNVSLGRYCAPVYLGGILAVLLYVFDLAGPVETGMVSAGQRGLLAGAVAMILLCTNYSAVMISIWPLNTEVSEHMEAAEKTYAEEFRWADALEEGQGKVYYLNPAVDVHAVYCLIPVVIQQPGLYDPIYGIGDLQNYLHDREFRYVYCGDADSFEWVVSLFEQMLPDGEKMKNGELYKIDMSGVKFRLEKVEWRK